MWQVPVRTSLTLVALRCQAGKQGGTPPSHFLCSIEEVTNRDTHTHAITPHKPCLVRLDDRKSTEGVSKRIGGRGGKKKTRPEPGHVRSTRNETKQNGKRTEKVAKTTTSNAQRNFKFIIVYPFFSLCWIVLFCLLLRTAINMLLPCVNYSITCVCCRC